MCLNVFLFLRFRGPKLVTVLGGLLLFCFGALSTPKEEIGGVAQALEASELVWTDIAHFIEDRPRLKVVSWSVSGLIAL